MYSSEYKSWIAEKCPSNLNHSKKITELEPNHKNQN